MRMLCFSFQYQYHEHHFKGKNKLAAHQTYSDGQCHEHPFQRRRHIIWCNSWCCFEVVFIVPRPPKLWWGCGVFVSLKWCSLLYHWRGIDWIEFMGSSMQDMCFYCSPRGLRFSWRARLGYSRCVWPGSPKTTNLYNNQYNQDLRKRRTNSSSFCQMALYWLLYRFGFCGILAHALGLLCAIFGTCPEEQENNYEYK